VYDSLGVYSEYILGFSGAIYKSYFIRMKAGEAYASFLEQQNKDKKEHVAKLWSCCETVLLYKVM
jgi:hypothetical protein